ncbi:uncharacterized protein MYCGRDRAFT_32708 [Zymoseptoria tritici IPO323]|uniref:Glucose-methanol-choline oxidoreductase N-terminal domain-containing protein n=1 Tax=Zymoseptoria tritici (strain CBS 115943 / IPO323) TaxID=336722 RepID=F9WX39_ZYMTI|nr:uncharacterized protein MYCGRDRAFT_32708 [Zymoseptoria tritici IPO323]EGP91678.1 hypothetical protein MYCGRDRAFT_32708 [Zymoseptoria tritici IPO323]
MHVAQAKVVGGGSSINGGTALRNAVKDCEEWVLLGNDAWGWDSVEPVYDFLEKDDLRPTKGFHPLVRTKIEGSGLIQQAFVAGAIEAGLPWVADLNATGAEGTGASPVCRNGERRISAANTFIDPIRGRRNFRIQSNAFVDRVLFSDRRATGVKLVDGSQISASCEVILAASALFSPAILQRSGVGPSALLESLAIPVLQDLPVGHNLSDHPCIPPGASSRPQRSLGGSETGHVAGIGCNLNKPTSHGSVQIGSKDPLQQPVVRPNYLTTAEDRTSAREIVRLGYKIMLSRSMQSRLSLPLGITDDTIRSDNLLDKWIQSQYSSTYHFCCSCRMAARESGGVVDQSGRVYGVKGLRVVDASVIPTVPAANTMWTTMMFAERIGRSLRDGVDVGPPLRSGRSEGLSRL